MSSDLPRKFSKQTPLNVSGTDLALLLELYYFIDDELSGTVSGQAAAMCEHKLSEIRTAIEVQVFGNPLAVDNTVEVEGDKPEDIDLTQFDEEGK